ncbi:MAG: acyltransferase [Myxococcales bacterium]|nr:acyltransferase [Myxococcales bacterium]
MSPQPTASPHLRNPQIDILRGLAMVGVVVIHLVARIGPQDPLYAAGRVTDHLSRFGVPLFLAVLGWSVGKDAVLIDNWSAWLGRRWRAVGWPYLAWAFGYAFMAPMDAQGVALLGGDLPWPGRILSAIFGYGSEQLYYMTAYFGLLLVAPLLGLLLRSGGAVVAIAVGTGALLANWALLASVQSAVQSGLMVRGITGFLLHTEARTPLHWFGFFAVGATIGRLITLGWRPPAWLPKLAVPALAVHLWIAVRPQSSPRFDDFWCSPAMVYGALTFALWGPPVARQLRSMALGVGLALIGRQSLAVYLSHVLWLRLTWLACRDLPTPMALALTLVGTVVGTWLYLRVHPRLFGALRMCP